jgi:hypothetical protein
MKKIILTLAAIVFTSVMVQAQTARTAATKAKAVEKVEQKVYTTSTGADVDPDATHPVQSNKAASGEDTKKAMIEVEKTKEDYKKQVKAKIDNDD